MTTSPEIDGDLPEAFVSILSFQYIKWRLSLEEYDFDECSGLPQPNYIDYVLRDKCSDSETEMDALLFDMLIELKISPMTTFPEFMELVDRRLFHACADWSKIYALFAFCGKLCVSCLDKAIPQVIGNVGDWLAVFLDSKLTGWIADNGGWEYVIKE